MTPSPTQRETLRRLAASESQRLERRQGGFWCLPETAERESGACGPVPEWSITVQTVRAMERAGWLARANRWPDEWRDARALTEAGMVAAGEIDPRAGRE